MLEGEEGGGSGTQKLVYQKWPDKIFPTVNFVFSRGGPGEGTPPSSYSVRPF